MHVLLHNILHDFIHSYYVVYVGNVIHSHCVNAGIEQSSTSRITKQTNFIGDLNYGFKNCQNRMDYCT